MAEFVLDGESLDINSFVEIARNYAAVRLSPKAIDNINKCRKVVNKLVERKEAIYGLTTGFGSLSNVSISPKDTEELQENLIRSHAAGVGNPLAEEIVRGAMLLRINTFCKGFSGVKLDTVELLVEMLNRRVYPYVPEKGSVGSSGDLAPLSHLTLVLLGLGKAFLNGKVVSGKEALEKVGLKPIRLMSKEGLAMNNGTATMTSIAALNIFDAVNLLKNAVIAAGMSFEALLARTSPLDERIHKARPQKGQIACAEMLRKLLDGSELLDSDKTKIQDAYSLRAAPVVLGASLDAINYAKSIVEIELNSATDNPLIFGEEARSGANFHGQPIALAMDFLGIAVAELGDISERRVARMVDDHLNSGLPAFLVQSSGLNSGFMIPQYTAAALVSENKILAHPASVDSIPTCANQEDHVSMGTIASRKARDMIFNTENVIAIELMCAAQGVELRKGKPSKNISNVISAIRKNVPPLKKDRELSEDIEIIRNLLHSGDLVIITDI